MEWARPDVLLVVGKMDEELALVRVRELLERIRPWCGSRLWLRIRRSWSLLCARKAGQRYAEAGKGDEEPAEFPQHRPRAPARYNVLRLCSCSKLVMNIRRLV